jgi:hypothetical protein
MCTMVRLATVDDNSPSRHTTKRQVYLVGNCDSIAALHQERVYQDQKLMHGTRHKAKSDVERTRGINDCKTQGAAQLGLEVILERLGDAPFTKWNGIEQGLDDDQAAQSVVVTVPLRLIRYTGLMKS